jgi:hypothetical protein
MSAAEQWDIIDELDARNLENDVTIPAENGV